MTIDADTLKEWLEEWKRSLDCGSRDEWWGTERMLCGAGGDDFVEWVIKNKLTDDKDASHDHG
jgi:hypothetical protein